MEEPVVVVVSRNILSKRKSQAEKVCLGNILIKTTLVKSLAEALLVYPDRILIKTILVPRPSHHPVFDHSAVCKNGGGRPGRFYTAALEVALRDDVYATMTMRR